MVKAHDGWPGPNKRLWWMGNLLLRTLSKCRPEADPSILVFILACSPPLRGNPAKDRVFESLYSKGVPYFVFWILFLV